MYRIRFHGRGGQGIKTASRILGSALFLAGYEVQDAPHYGAERRGAPMHAVVRAARGPIQERGFVDRPDLVVVADEGLLAEAGAAILQGLDHHSLVLTVGREPAALWQDRLRLAGPVLALADAGIAAGERHFLGAFCAGAAARLLGGVDLACLLQAVDDEVASFGAAAVGRSRELAEAGWRGLEEHAGSVGEGSAGGASGQAPPDWIELQAEAGDLAAPSIHGGLSSVEVRTGLWRTQRPVIDYEHCRRCWWVCSEFCPDSAISVDADGSPTIDYAHCKGCLICVAQCPAHAIRAIPEQGASS